MGYWGKILGGMAGFALGGPFGAFVGAAVGHAAENGGLNDFKLGMAGPGSFGSARLAALLGGREQLFAVGAVFLSAKLAKCDGPVTRTEIDAFKRHFRIPPESLRDVGRLFDQARDSPEDHRSYARQIGEAFADNLGMLEDVLAAFFAIARADRPLNVAEETFLLEVAIGFGLDERAWARASGEEARRAQGEAGEDPYAVLGIDRSATPTALRARWKDLMRENHPDSLASRGVPEEFVRRAGDKVARINAAWDRIKRERGL